MLSFRGASIVPFHTQRRLTVSAVVLPLADMVWLSVPTQISCQIVIPNVGGGTWWEVIGSSGQIFLLLMIVGEFS